jgi:hypothetical protein
MSIDKFLISVFCAFLPVNVVIAETLIVSETTIENVVINGGQDSPNVGTSCIKLATPISATCSEYLAIRNNNKELISAVLTAKASNAKVWVSYYTQQPSLHCPDIAVTTCALSSIMLK